MGQLMPTTASPVIEVKVNGTMSAGGSNPTPSGNRFYYRQTTLAAPINKINVAAAFTTTLLTPQVAAQNAAYAVNSIDIRRIDDALDPYQRIISALVGAIGTDSEPSLDTVVVRVLTAFRGRPGRGFRRFGGTTEADTLRDVIVAPALARWQAVRNACRAGFTDADGNVWVPFHKALEATNYKTNPTTVRGGDIVNSTLNIVIASTRKRKAKSVIG